MENDIEDKPLKILQRHEPMKLVKRSGKGYTNRNYLKNLYWLYMIKHTTYSRNTTISYFSHVRKLIDSLDLTNPTLKCKQIELFLENKTIVIHAAIKSFLVYVERDYNMKFSSIKYPKVHAPDEKIIEVLSEDQIELIISKIPEEYKFYTKFLYMTACRISEPFRLTTGSINWRHHFKDKSKHALLKITHAKSKRDRLIPIRPSFVKEIRDYLFSVPGEEDLWGERYIFERGQNIYMKKKKRILVLRNKPFFSQFSDKQSKIYREKEAWGMFIRRESVRFQIVFRKASYDALGVYHSPHTLRKSRATILLKAGVPILGVMKILGHKDLKTTQRYLSFEIDELSRDMQRLGL